MAKVRADLLLVARGLAESRAKAQAAIAAGGVTADGRGVEKASELLEEACDLQAQAAHPYVGRGALKLVHALELWPVVVEGRVDAYFGWGVEPIAGYRFGLRVLGSDGVTALSLGAWSDPTVVFEGRVRNLSPIGGRVAIQIELKPIGSPFDGNGVATGPFVAAGQVTLLRDYR